MVECSVYIACSLSLSPSLLNSAWVVAEVGEVERLTRVEFLAGLTQSWPAMVGEVAVSVWVFCVIFIHINTSS